MKRTLLVAKILLIAFVIAYVASPTLIDAKYSGWVGLAIVLLIGLMAYEGFQAAKILKNGQKRDNRKDT